MQWNVWFKEDPNNLVELIKEVKPDILCGQEFFQNFTQGIDTARYIAEKTGMHYYYQIAETWTDREEIDTQGNAIFSKYPILNPTFKYIRQPTGNPKNASEEGRVYLEISIQQNNELITIGTTHLSYSPLFEITENRKKEVNNLVDILRTKKTNYFFTADLNSTPDSYTISEISKHLKNAGPDFSEKTWTTKPFEKQGFKTNALDWRLDYIFNTPDMDIKTAEVLQTSYSDHLPLVITF